MQELVQVSVHLDQPRTPYQKRLSTVISVFRGANSSTACCWTIRQLKDNAELSVKMRTNRAIEAAACLTKPLVNY